MLHDQFMLIDTGGFDNDDEADLKIGNQVAATLENRDSNKMKQNSFNKVRDHRS